MGVKREILIVLIFLIVLSDFVSASRLNVVLNAEITESEDAPLKFSLDKLVVDGLQISNPISGENKLIVETIYANGKSAEKKEVGFDFFLTDSVFVSPLKSIDVDFNYNKNLKTLKAFYNGKEVLNEDIAKLLCNNDNQCSGFENYLTCPADCAKNAQDGICNSEDGDGICDLDCELDKLAGGDCSANYVTLNVFENGGAFYCENNGAVYSQKIRNEEGDYAACASDYECSSNICQDEKCIDVGEVKESTGGFTKASCKIVHLFNTQEYNKCLYRFFTKTDIAGSVTGASIFAGVFDGIRGFFTNLALITGRATDESTARECTEDDWTSETKPALCPESGKQMIKWKKTGDCEGGVSHKDEEAECTQDACTGCSIPRWMAGSENLLKGKEISSACVPYGTRFEAEKGEINVKEKRAEARAKAGDYSLEIKSDKEATLSIYQTIQDKKDYNLVPGNSYEIAQPGWNDKIGIKVNNIFYKPYVDNNA